MATPEWAPLARNYEDERLKSRPDFESTSQHPLLPSRPKAAPVVVKEAKPATLGSNVKQRVSLAADPLADPLSGGGQASEDIVDPLNTVSDPLSSSSGSTKKAETNEVAKRAAIVAQEENLHSPWQLRKQQILRDYTITGNITVSSSVINEFSGSGVEDGSATRHLDKYTQRLANLERRYVSEEKVQLSFKEYEDHIRKLSDDLTRAWANDERVGSLKIAIQMAKLLADTNMPQFYPSMFVMVSNELDRFGEMVFNRLKGKAEEGLNEQLLHSKKTARLPANFTAADVPSNAKETCRNWFYKTACIRELLPRVYVEVALLRCYKFLTDTDFPQILSRIGSIIRGLGDPLVSLYARTYLVVVGNDICPDTTTHALSMFQDVTYSYKMLKEPHHVSELTRWKITAKEYYWLMSPGVEWVLRCVMRNPSKEVFQGILQQYRDHANDSMLLKHVIDSFDGSYYAHAALGMCTLIKTAEPSCYSQTDLFASLGKQLAIFPPPEEQRMPLLNEVWRIVSKCEDISSYVKCCASWMDMVQRHYSEREMLIILGDLSSKLRDYMATGNELSDTMQKHLETLLTSVIGQSATYGSAVLTSDHLLKILDAFTGIKKVELCKEILVSFRVTQKRTNDAVLINTMFDICRTVHDSVDCLSPEGERRQISNILNGFIGKIDFGRDLEQQLNVYVECRAIFCNLDLVKDQLILCVSGLAVNAFRLMKGKHSKKTSAFAKACMAYCHITVPSIADVLRKLELLLHCAQVALLNQCLPQTDTFLKAAISLIPEAPAFEEIEGKRVHTEDRVAAYLRSLLATLVVAPGHPEHGPFYIVQGMLNAVPKYPWQPITGVQTGVYVDILALLATYAQRKFPYRIPYVESNDDLYGGAPDYMAELKENIDSCMQEILRQLTGLGERTELPAKMKQARLVMDLVNQVAARMELSAEVGPFVLRLLELANKLRASFTRVDQRYFSNTLDFVRAKAQDSPAAGVLLPALRGMQAQ